MCLEFTGNKTLVCQVGDLKVGQQYRTPEGTTRIMTDGTTNLDGVSLMVEIETGKVFNVDNSTKLGTDRAGRMYASRSLNNPQPTAITVVPSSPDYIPPSEDAF